MWRQGLVGNALLPQVKTLADKHPPTERWVPADKDLSNAKLKGTDLSKCDLSGAD
jgi:uncharacterized protein YjbI with pentapeptide repeats